MTQLPKLRAFLGTIFTSFGIQMITLFSGGLTSRVLGADGRGLLAGAQLVPNMIAIISLLGINNVIAILVAKDNEKSIELSLISLKITLPLSIISCLVGWYIIPFVLPEENIELIKLSRFFLLYIPISIPINLLMSIDQGIGNFALFNKTRFILNPVYLALVIILSIFSLNQPFWFLLSLILSNLALLIYRLTFVKWKKLKIIKVQTNFLSLVMQGKNFFLTSIVYIVKDNIERFILLLLLGATSLGVYVVALSASGLHLILSKSLNLIVFSRGAALESGQAVHDCSRTFRIMAIINFFISLLVIGLMPILIPVVFGSDFNSSIVPAMLLVISQYFLCQASLLDEGLRSQQLPLFGMQGVIGNVLITIVLGLVFVPNGGTVSMTIISIISQVCYLVWMIISFKRIDNQVKLLPELLDLHFIITKLKIFSLARL